MKTEQKYVIVYQYFTGIFSQTCHFDFVQGNTLESAKEVLNERRRTHSNLQMLFASKTLIEDPIDGNGRDFK
jgi:hypothetical protein